MCIFSLPVRDVANTRIFARLSLSGSQYLVYSMKYAAQQDLAMILPLPVALPAREESVRFINLKGYPTFFDDLDDGFPEPKPMVVGGAAGGGYAGSVKSFLPVQAVGDFVATFVPRLADFRRIHPRFKLPQQVWGQIPLYKDYGFAVFQLRARVAPTAVHPMALVFETRMLKSLFLPTVHIHDGQIHPTEMFDHSLYVQDYRLMPTDQRNSFGGAASVPMADVLRASQGVIKRFVDVRRAQEIIEPNEIAFKRRLHGVLANQDTIIPCGTV